MQLQLYEQDSGCQDESRSKQNIMRILFLNIISNQIEYQENIWK